MPSLLSKLTSICLTLTISLTTLTVTNTTSPTCNNNDEQQCHQSPVNYLSDSVPIVIISYEDLLHRSQGLEASIEAAYGASGLGILLVSDVPNVDVKRQRLLRLSRMLAVDLPESYRTNLVHAASFYSIGWSHGVEKLSKDMPDLRKASYYANPIYDDPTDGNNDLITSYPAFYYPNIWPHTVGNNNDVNIMNKDGINDDNDDIMDGIDISEIKSFKKESKVIKEIGMSLDEFGIELKEAFMSLGGLIYRVGGMLSDVMDNYVSNVREHTNYKPNTLKRAIQTKHPKARLLYYFSENEYKTIIGDDSDGNSDENNANDNRNVNDEEDTPMSREDSWCGWHNDHSALTGLALGMYFDENGNIVEKLGSSVAGLHVKNRMNRTYHLQFDNVDAGKYLAFQIGETSQILSGGALFATPHAVRGPIENKYNNIGRGSFAIFMQPSHDHHMRAPSNLNITNVQFDRHLPHTVPTLKSRWNNETDDTFGQFSQRTFETYY